MNHFINDCNSPTADAFINPAVPLVPCSLMGHESDVSFDETSQNELGSIRINLQFACCTFHQMGPMDFCRAENLITVLLVCSFVRLCAAAIL